MKLVYHITVKSRALFPHGYINILIHGLQVILYRDMLKIFCTQHKLSSHQFGRKKIAIVLGKMEPIILDFVFNLKYSD